LRASDIPNSPTARKVPTPAMRQPTARRFIG
jgi:hypothetical protein